MTPDPIARMDCIVESNGARISYSVEGPAARPVLLFINSIGTTRDLWSPQIPALVGTYRIIRYDARGHGTSAVPAGNYSIEQLARDALAILDAEDVKQAHVCGISLGGITAMWLGVHAPDRVSSLILANTAARIGSVESWTDRIALVQERGFSLLDIKRYVESLGMRGRGYRINEDRLRSLRVPGLVLMDVRGFRHFVVLKQVIGERVELADPILGNRNIPLSEFIQGWPSRAVFVVIGSDFDRNTVLLQPSK